MINESGTMTGGGGRPRSGRMCIGSQAPRSLDARAAAEELQLSEGELSAIQDALRDARGQKEDAANDAKNNERMLSDLETAIPKAGEASMLMADRPTKCSIDDCHPARFVRNADADALSLAVHSLQARMEAEAATTLAIDLHQRMGDLEAATQATKEDTTRLKVLCAEVSRQEAALADLRSKSQGLFRQAEALQQQIEGAGGKELRGQRSLCMKLQEVSARSLLSQARNCDIASGWMLPDFPKQQTPLSSSSRTYHLGVAPDTTSPELLLPGHQRMREPGHQKRSADWCYSKAAG